MAWVVGFGCQGSGFGFRVSGSGFKVSGFGFVVVGRDVGRGAEGACNVEVDPITIHNKPPRPDSISPRERVATAAQKLPTVSRLIFSDHNHAP